MNPSLSRALLVLSLLALVTCSSDANQPSAPPTHKPRVGSTRGGAIVLSRDERVAVACNRTAGVVTVFALDPLASAANVILRKKEIDIGADWEPWAAVIGADDDTAYVISRQKQVVLRIVGLHSDPLRDDSLLDVRVGSEPTAIAIAPSGARIFVANWGEGTISIITTYDFKNRSNLDLNDSLAQTGVLGIDHGRPALAHPRALAITDNGDSEDGDETLYATEFFSQPGPSTPGVVMGPPSQSDAAPVASLPEASPPPDTGPVCNGEPCTLPEGGVGADDSSSTDSNDATPDGSGSSPQAGDAQVDAAVPAPSVPTGDLTVFDRNRQGFVYPLKLSPDSEVGKPIPISPVLDTGFFDAPSSTADPAQRRATSCFPNQLYAAAVQGERLYITSMCASPVGPLGPAKLADGSANPANFKTLVHPVIFVVDTKNDVEVPEERVVLTQVLEQHYANDQAIDRRFPLIPNDIAATQRDGRVELLLTALGADAVFRVDYNQVPSAMVGVPGERFIDLHPKDLRAGQLPIGIAASNRAEAPFALVVNDATQNVSAIDLATSTVSAVENASEELPRAVAMLRSNANEGHRLFATGLGSWSFKGEAWLSCEGCHPDGLSDGVTWFFARGPRRTISTANTYDGSSPAHRRVMLWTGNIDEVHDIEAIVRGVAGGTGVMLWDYPIGELSNDLRILYDGSAVPKGAKFDAKPTTSLLNNLNGSLASLIQDQFCPAEGNHCDGTRIADWNNVDAYIRTVRAPRAPAYLDKAKIDAGKKIFFSARCSGCHGGPNFSLSMVFYTPGPENNGALPYTQPTSSDFGTMLPGMLGRLRSETYDVPAELRLLNPPGNSGTAPLRRWNPGASDPVKYAYDPATATNDQINCVLRDVGTFPVQSSGATHFDAIVPTGARAVPEVRQDMKTLAVGASGFNIPTLIGVSAGAPYFHAGNARTLEEAFDMAFEKHHHALSTMFPDPTQPRDVQVDSLVTYLLSLDDASPAPPDDPAGLDLCARTGTPLH